MTPPTFNQEHRQFLSRKIVAAAQSILSGEIGVVAGAYELGSLGRQIGANRDPDFELFIGIDSETDHLPVGEVRKYWNPEALRAKDAELARFESQVRDRAFEACRSLIQKYDLAA
jgi:hypothetical protein